MQQIYLTRRNLQTLLNKLDRTAKGEKSACTIIKYEDGNKTYPQSMSACMVIAVEDADYYTDREPGAIFYKDVP
jgi:hypothetical protein